MKYLKIIGLIGGTIAIAYVLAWVLQEDKSSPPRFEAVGSDRDGKPPGKH
ncbi:hypothetical protein [Hirschia litorea]|uniref:Uncharacterized protein n=1 Tax=Hirschia litorea TaxID=1199156 RepID=A0ABW2IMU5_9PROT